MSELVHTRLHGPIPSADAPQEVYDRDAAQTDGTKVYWADGRREKYLRAGIPPGKIYNFLRGNYTLALPEGTSASQTGRKWNLTNGDWGGMVPELFEAGKAIPGDRAGSQYSFEHYGTFPERVILAMERAWGKEAFAAPLVIDADALSADMCPMSVVEEETRALLRLAGLLHYRGVKVIVNRANRYNAVEVARWLTPKAGSQDFFDGLSYEHIGVGKSWESSSRLKAQQLIVMLPAGRSLIVSASLPADSHQPQKLSGLVRHEVEWLRRYRGSKEVTLRLTREDGKELPWQPEMGRLSTSRKAYEEQQSGGRAPTALP